MVHQDLSWVSDLSDTETPYSAYCTSSGQIVPQSPHQYHGHALIWWIPVYCPSLVCTYGVFEMVMLQSENVSAIASFIFKDILCHWGTVSELVTDNGTSYIQALNILVDWYGIPHIWISSCNSQVNGMIEQCHYNIQVLQFFFLFFPPLMNLLFCHLYMDITSHSHPCDSLWLILSLTRLILDAIPLLGSSLLELCLMFPPTHLQTP